MINSNLVLLIGKLIEDILIIESKYGKTYGIISIGVKHSMDDEFISVFNQNRFDVFIWDEGALESLKLICKKIT